MFRERIQAWLRKARWLALWKELGRLCTLRMQGVCLWGSSDSFFPSLKWLGSNRFAWNSTGRQIRVWSLGPNSIFLRFKRTNSLLVLEGEKSLSSYFIPTHWDIRSEKIFHRSAWVSSLSLAPWVIVQRVSLGMTWTSCPSWPCASRRVCGCILRVQTWSGAASRTLCCRMVESSPKVPTQIGKRPLGWWVPRHSTDLILTLFYPKAAHASSAFSEFITILQSGQTRRWGSSLHF